MKNLIRFFEIPAADFTRAVSFYEALFGYTLDVHDWGGEKMAFFPEDEVNVRGAVILSKGYEPNDQGVLISLDADGRMEEMLKQIESLGGSVIKGRCPIQEGSEEHFAIFKDTEGNRLGLHSND